MAHYNPFDNLQSPGDDSNTADTGNNSSSNASSIKKRGLTRGSKPLPNGKKKNIDVNSWGQPNQANSETNTYTSDIGFQVRMYLPIIYESFKDVHNDCIVLVVKGLKKFGKERKGGTRDMGAGMSISLVDKVGHIVNENEEMGSNNNELKFATEKLIKDLDALTKYVGNIPVISPTDNFHSQQATSSSQREHEKHQHIGKECMLVDCPWRIVAHGVIVGVDSIDMLEIKQRSEGKEAPGLVEAQVYSRDEIWEQLIGSQKRAVGSTNANELSSRNDD
ncbi:hypothetical protein GIB67_015155 [Kingdonia uniflora]|uniref:Uncharacterized protein n=1 Tax=Kingdonia uniflora TaxID=39325 RepID=A0A7J7LJC7_9MAGN|nr:hypothetical protein GIB67_015155 [Kingdonia uniflora]